MKKTLTPKEKEVLSRISRLISRRLRLLAKMRAPVSGMETPVTLTELNRYMTGVQPIPVCNLVELLKFWGCTQQEIAEWNLKISVLTYYSLKRARGESSPPGN